MRTEFEIVKGFGLFLGYETYTYAKRFDIVILIGPMALTLVFEKE